MEVFEFLFNPQKREDVIFESFYFQPKEPFEKRLGHLFIFGMLKNCLPKNLNFLKELSQKVKDEFYKATFSKTKIALKETLKKTNEFLQEKLKEGEVDWLGNFSCAIFVIKNLSLFFTKTGKIKIILFRGGKILDIGEKLKFQDLEPYPLKLFNNIIVSNFSEQDTIFIFTQEVFQFFQSENIFVQLKNRGTFNGKEIFQLLEEKEKTMKELFGISLAISFKKEKEYSKESFSFSEKKYFSFKEVFQSVAVFLRKFIEEKTPPLFQRLMMSQPPVSLEVIKNKRKKNFLIVISIFLLIGGLFFLNYKERERIKYYQNFFYEIEKGISEKSQEKELEIYLKSSLKKIYELDYDALPKELKNKYLSLKEVIIQKLKEVNKFQQVKDPEVFFAIPSNYPNTERIFLFQEYLLLFSSKDSKILKVNQQKETEEIKIKEKPHLIQKWQEKIIIFYLPNSIYILDKDKIDIEELPLPSFPFSFDDLDFFKENFYFLDKENGEILKYQKKEEGFSLPQVWIKDKKSKNTVSFSVDGSIWVINNENELFQYYQGRIKQKIKLDIFPEIKTIKKIITAQHFKNLYLLDPKEKRIIILDKEGKIVKQIFSDKFKSPMDFLVLPNEKEVLVLDNNIIYRIKIPF